jgi:purine-binding chemotaxis protein CheW
MEGKSRLCTFHLDSLWFGVAVERVQEVISSPAITTVPLATSGVAGLVNLRGQIVTAIDLWRRLGFPERPAAMSPAIVVIRSGNATAGLLVDKVGDVVEAPEEAFDAVPAHLRGELRELVPRVCRFPRRLLHVLDLDRVLESQSPVALSGEAMKEAVHFAD